MAWGFAGSFAPGKLWQGREAVQFDLCLPVLNHSPTAAGLISWLEMQARADLLAARRACIIEKL